MSESAKCFLKNLQQLASELGHTSHAELASALGYKENNRRWIRRIWTNGLDRPDYRRAKNLKDLANLLGVEVDDLWKPRIEIRNTEVVRDPRRWAEIVRAVIETYLQFQFVKSKSKDSAIHALGRYDGDEWLLVADLVAENFGADRPRLDRLIPKLKSTINKQMLEWQELVDGDLADDALLNILAERYQSHEWYKPLMDELRLKYGEETEQQVRRQLRAIKLRPRMANEVIEEFKSLYLDSNTEDEGFDEAMRIVTNELRQIWRIAVEKNPRLTPKAFSKMISKLINDPPSVLDDKKSRTHVGLH